MNSSYDNENITTCFSSHLTNFAVIFTGGTKLNDQDEQVLSYLTLIGLGISSFGAFSTILTYLIFP